MLKPMTSNMTTATSHPPVRPLHWIPKRGIMNSPATTHAETTMPHNPRRAFTLIELLVVIGIIAILVSILLPVLSKVRTQSDRVACRAHLRDIGASFTMYFTDSKNRLPLVNPMPSVKPPINSGPSLPKLLEPYIKSATGVFRCPSDRITQFTDGAPTNHQTYFDREGSSYAYNPGLALHAGKKLQDKETLFFKDHPNLATIVDEYEAFHGKAGTPGAMNRLFRDLHVASVGE